MKWGIQHVSIQIANDDGEIVTVEQDEEGKVHCEPGGRSNVGKPTKTKPETGAKTEAKSKTSKPEKAANAKPAAPAAKPEKPVKPEKPAKPAKPEKPEAAKGKPGRPRKATSLDWKPVVDAGYRGFSAKSDGGKFMLLKAKGSQWALFFQRPDAQAEPIACFKDDGPGKVRAQELHDRGMPKVEQDIRYQIVNVCPMPGDEASEPETAAEGPSSTSVEPSAGEATAEKDDVMLASLAKVLEKY